ncbi:hypothetical protein H4R33_006826 [Dimargaris cristalligena]|nr:hypothetical protein H4R33_006826 [Dimargaris cristalligena]
MPNESTSYPNHLTNDYSNLEFGTPIAAAQQNAKLNEYRRKNPFGLTVTTGFTKDKRVTPPNDDENQVARNNSFWIETPTPLREKPGTGGFQPGEVNDAPPTNTRLTQTNRKGSFWINTPSPKDPVFANSPSEYVDSPANFNNIDQLGLYFNSLKSTQNSSSKAGVVLKSTAVATPEDPKSLDSTAKVAADSGFYQPQPASGHSPPKKWQYTTPSMQAPTGGRTDTLPAGKLAEDEDEDEDIFYDAKSVSEVASDALSVKQESAAPTVLNTPAQSKPWFWQRLFAKSSPADVAAAPAPERTEPSQLSNTSSGWLSRFSRA